MTKVEKVQYTSKPAATGGRDGGSHSNAASLAPKRPSFLATLAGVGVLGLAVLASPSFAQIVPTADVRASVKSPFSARPHTSTEDTSIRPFHIHVSEEQLVDLRKRIAATRWPGKETVNDESQGIRLTEMQALVHYWGTDYDWRKAEAKLNALPEFVTTIDGVDIQFIHVPSREPNALPLIKVPVAITVFPHEIYRAPESWSRQAYPSLYYFHEVAKGGHFAAWEQPELFSEEMRAAFRSLRPVE